MPNYALDQENRTISATEALRNAHYRCIECGSLLQKRKGELRRPYFSHLKQSLSCRLYSRSIDHLILQHRLQKSLPALQQERPFPNIRRIADLCWEEKKLIFEIQCSPIAVQQARERVHDYALEGYALIWLLDDRLYNKRRLRHAEQILRSQGYFFSLKLDLIYDQFEVIDQEVRLFKGPKLPIDLSQPLPLIHRMRAPQQLREYTGLVHFQGNLYDRAQRSSTYLPQLIELEQTTLRNQPIDRQFFFWKAMREWFYRGLEFLLRSIS